MVKESVKALKIIVLITFFLVGCNNNTSEKQYLSEIGSLKKEIEELKNNISKNDQMQIEIDNLKDEINSLKNTKESYLEASVYNQSNDDKDIVVIIDFKKDNGIDKDIYFIILSGNLQGQGVANGYSIARYDEIIIPGMGTIATDDVPKDVTRYRISFPTRNKYVFNVIAIEKILGYCGSVSYIAMKVIYKCWEVGRKERGGINVL